MRDEQKLIFTNDVAHALSTIVAELKPNRTIVVADPFLAVLDEQGLPKYEILNADLEL